MMHLVGHRGDPQPMELLDIERLYRDEAAHLLGMLCAYLWDRSEAEDVLQGSIDALAFRASGGADLDAEWDRTWSAIQSVGAHPGAHRADDLLACAFPAHDPPVPLVHCTDG
jgi:hypothetical protein